MYKNDKVELSLVSWIILILLFAGGCWWLKFTTELNDRRIEHYFNEVGK